MTIQEKGNIIRLMAVATVIAEYANLKLIDDTKHELKQRVKDAIKACRRVQGWFTTHENATSETRELMKVEFLSGEIVLMSELLETCFNLDEQSLENIISSIKQALEPVESKPLNT